MNTIQIHKRGDKRGNGNLRGAGENAFVQLAAFFKVTFYILDGHRRVVHQDADRQGQAAKRHDVDGLVQRA